MVAIIVRVDFIVSHSFAHKIVFFLVVSYEFFEKMRTQRRGG